MFLCINIEVHNVKDMDVVMMKMEKETKNRNVSFVRYHLKLYK
jgi:hypothetical protein